MAVYGLGKKMLFNWRLQRFNRFSSLQYIYKPYKFNLYKHHLIRTNFNSITMKLTYDSWKFTELYETDIGQELWKFLCLPENIVRAETAVDLRRTCVEALERPLNERFGKELQRLIDEDKQKGEQKFLRLKQMIGHMVGQIMLSRGFAKDKEGVILPKREEDPKRILFFKKAIRFRRE